MLALQRHTMPPTGSSAIRACDTCRRRKVKCDAAQLCANCRISGRCCEYTAARKRRGPKVPKSRGRVGDAADVSATPTSDGVAIFSDGHPSLSTQPSVWPITNMVNPPASEEVPSTGKYRLIREHLLVSLASSPIGLPVVDIANQCIDFYMRYTFPTAPLVHEPTLREAVSLFFSDTAPTDAFEADSYEGRVAQARLFSLVTGLCASITSVTPEDLLPYRQFLTESFLGASREALISFELYDMEHPNSTSLAIRAFHSTAMQQSTGKFGAAWHIHSQACLLAQDLRLYSETAVRRHDPLEARLLRLNFWHLYTADKAAAAFRTRPFTLHEALFDEELTIEPCGDPSISLLGKPTQTDNGQLEERFLVGFHLIRRIWSSASGLLSSLRVFRQQTEEVKSQLGHEYLNFMGLMNELPSWLTISDIVSSHDVGGVTAEHKPSFWIQRCTIMVTFYCLRLVILQQCVDSDAHEVAGLPRDQVSTMLTKKLEMVQDFVQALEDIPFIYLQVKGEPNVSIVAVPTESRLLLTKPIDRKDTPSWGYPSRVNRGSGFRFLEGQGKIIPRAALTHTREA